MGCDKHPKSTNYLNPDTNANSCWQCYLEDGFSNYEGKVIITYSRVAPYYLRLRVVSRHSIFIEGWRKQDNGKYAKVGRFIQEEYMSRAGRRWDAIVKVLDQTRELDMNVQVM